MTYQNYAIKIEKIAKRLNNNCERGECGRITDSDFIRKQPLLAMSVLLMQNYITSNKQDEILNYIFTYFSYASSSIDEICEKNNDLMEEMFREFNELID